MRKSFLIAGVAAIALTMPAQAKPERGGGDKAERQAQRAERQQARPERAERQAQRAERPQRAERQAQRVERQQARPQRAERQAQRAERQQMRPQRAERQAQRVERQQARPQRAERQARRIERQQARPQRAERQAQRIERQQARPQRVERQARRIERQQARPQRIERQAQRAEQRAIRQQQRQAQRIERVRDRGALQAVRDSNRFERQAARDANRFDRRALRAGQRQALAAQAWQQNVVQRFERFDDDDRGDAVRIASIGQRIEPVWYDDYVPVRYRTSYFDTPDYYYRTDWDDGYMYRVNRDDNLVAALIPLLGGAYSVGNMYPVAYNTYYGSPYYSAGYDPYQGFGYSPYYNVPLGYRSLYYDTPDAYYRYGSGAIYQVDPTTQLITAVVSLLTGANFNIGQQMPLGYDVYNVPYAYRDQYYDTSDAWYRYDDGFVYQVDPRSRLIQQAYPVSYNGFALGSSIGDPYWDDYYADYNVPYGYRDVYYDTDDDYYRYYNGGIYQVDPQTRMVQALVALATGTQLDVGQAMPVGYDVYNLPYQYRTTYYDTPDSWYRYNDGYIYRVDPQTRLIQEVIDAIV